MKKNLLFLIAISLVFASCGKDPEDEWSRYYGYTQADIVGHYEANPDQSLYEDLPTTGISVYSNASIDIGAVGNASISLHVVIPGKVNKDFRGPIDMSDDNRSDIVLSNVIDSLNKEDIMMTVYKNEEERVRFHGRVKRYFYKRDPKTHKIYLDRSDNWGFDVIKEEDRSKK